MELSAASTGPHLNLAVLCEKVLQEQDGVISVIRVIDRLVQSATGPDVPDQMPPFLANNLTMVVSLRSDQARGRYGLKIRAEAPGGFQLPALEHGVQLQGGNTGVNLVMPLSLPIAHDGVYWFDVFLTGPAPKEDRLLTRVPLEVVYQPLRVGGSPPG